jgi:hypothetical protein
VSGVRLDEVRNEPKRSGGLREFQLETVVRFLVGTFIGFMDWWMGDENDHLPAEQVDHAFRSLVLPGVAKVLELELELPNSL